MLKSSITIHHMTSRLAIVIFPLLLLPTLQCSSNDATVLSQGGSSLGGTTSGGYSGNLSGGKQSGGILSGGTPSGGILSGGRPSGGAIAVGGTTQNTGGVTAGPLPQLPPITGTCPTFVTGTTTIGGLAGIALQVGPKQNGTGSLLFYWHGTGSTASEVNRMVPASVRAEILSAGGIIVSFQGSTDSGGDCSGTNTFSKGDFAIADLIAACAVQNHGIDPRRIYTTGCSAGGLQAGCMGAMRSSYIAATVPNSGGEVIQQAVQDPKHLPAVMTMHGGSSDVVIVSFANTSATYDKHISSLGGFVINCNHGGGHCQAPQALYSAGWEFMKAHPFGVEPKPYSNGLPTTFPSYCKIY
jgi:hypothetical protein